MSYLPQNGSFWKRSSQPISWRSTEETKGDPQKNKQTRIRKQTQQAEVNQKQVPKTVVLRPQRPGMSSQRLLWVDEMWFITGTIRHGLLILCVGTTAERLAEPDAPCGVLE